MLYLMTTWVQAPFRTVAKNDSRHDSKAKPEIQSTVLKYTQVSIDLWCSQSLATSSLRMKSEAKIQSLDSKTIQYKIDHKDWQQHRS
jgi:hypothetical protein